MGLVQGVTADQGLRLLSLLRQRIAPTNKSVEKFVGIFTVRPPPSPRRAVVQSVRATVTPCVVGR